MTTTLITGPNRGLGFEVARQLVAAGPARGIRPRVRPDQQVGDGDQLIVISAFWDAALQAKQLGLA